jgi:trehalose 6-phosphate phosphatase
MSSASEQRANFAVPAPHSNWALFLDIDGTLLDIAISPEAVVVPDNLVPLLRRAVSWLDGAVAVVSGRPLVQIDRLTAPLVLPCAGEHGACLRMPWGAIETASPEDVMPESWVTRLRDGVRGHSGIIVEEKSRGVAVHFRKAPEREQAVRQLVETLVAEEPETFEVLPASMAFEIRNRKLTKGLAVLRLMANPPFAGRIPVFIGDDVTDEDGFRAARALGGVGLNVHEFFGGLPSNVLRWLDASVPEMEA